MSNPVVRFFRNFQRRIRNRISPPILLDPPSDNSSRATLIPPKEPALIVNQSPFLERESCDCETFDFSWSKSGVTNYYYDENGSLTDVQPPPDSQTQTFQETTTGPPRLVFFSFPRGENFVDNGFFYTRNICQNGVKVGEQNVSFGNNIGEPDGVTRRYFLDDSGNRLLQSFDLQIIDSQPRDLLSQCFLGEENPDLDSPGGEEAQRFFNQDDVPGPGYEPYYDLPPPSPDADSQFDIPIPEIEPFGGPGVGSGSTRPRPAGGGGDGGGTTQGPPPTAVPIPIPPPPDQSADPNGPSPSGPPDPINNNPPPEDNNNDELIQKLNQILEKLCQEIAGNLLLGEDKDPEKEGDYFEYSELGNQYSGEGLLGLKNQIEKLSEQIKNLHESQVKSIQPLLSLPSILPQKCNDSENSEENNSRIIPVDLEEENLFNAAPEDKFLSSYLGIKMLDWLLFNQKNILEESCEEALGAFINPIYINDAAYSGDILHIYWVKIENYPIRKPQDPTWSCQIPNPIEGLNWADHFRNLRWHKGNQYGELRYKDFGSKNKGYFLDEDKANEYFDEIIQLTNLEESDTNSRSFSNIINPKFTVNPVILRPYRAYVSRIFGERDRKKVLCFAPLDEDYEQNDNNSDSNQ